MVNCEVTPQTVSTCPNQDNHQACLASYARLIGTEMTPNYVDSSFSNWTVSPWCSCKGSGNQEEECSNFLREFTHNTCLRNAIQAFGYGLDNMQNKNASVPGPSATTKTGSDWTTAPSEHPFVIIHKYPDPSEVGLGKTRGLPEDHSACLCANVWALVPALALALVLAQHAL
ncbi:GDNF family receptor alpha-2-like [Notothenia coriiceps]|uniref:GDNF family receptor alpha-2-like n=1 Tax=Notothenia coriiceps TaxID=8208 RepID=A0A6I9MMW6_9TELE|nr:PREDICTED: GDNF family receptor alpha-2-like [Notothenia coriiceps]